MADEEELDLEVEKSAEETNKVEKRIKDLSGKVRTTSEERDAAKIEADKAKTEAQAALKDVDFYKNFSAINSKYAGASEYQEKIREKVNAGYDLEDATISVMAKEGKLSSQTPPPPKPSSPAGGSAPTNLTQGGDKALADMTQAERRAQLLEAERKGDIGLT